MTTRRAVLDLSLLFVLWLLLKAAGVGLSYLWYLALCGVLLFGPWASRGVARGWGITGAGVRIVAGYVFVALLRGVVVGAVASLLVPRSAFCIGAAWALLTFLLLCICGTAR